MTTQVKKVKVKVYDNEGRCALEYLGYANDVAQCMSQPVATKLAKDYASDMSKTEGEQILSKEQNLMMFSLDASQQKIVRFVKQYWLDHEEWPTQTKIKLGLKLYIQQFDGRSGDTACSRQIEKLVKLNLLKTSGKTKPKQIKLSEEFECPEKFLQKSKK